MKVKNASEPVDSTVDTPAEPKKPELYFVMSIRPDRMDRLDVANFGNAVQGYGPYTKLGADKAARQLVENGSALVTIAQAKAIAKRTDVKVEAL